MQTTARRSLTVIFHAHIDGDFDQDEPTPGLATTEFVKHTLTEAGWVAGELEVRHASWFFVARRGEARVEFMFAAPQGALRYGLVVAEEEHGFFGGLKRTFATPADVFEVARVVSAALSEPKFSHQRWAWDDEPNDDSPPEPPPL